MIHLKDRAARAGKEASWAKRVEGLAKLYLRPKWGKWSLATMSDNPAAVRDWHADLAARAPVSANHAARVVRAVYRHAARLNRSLPPGPTNFGGTLRQGSTTTSRASIRSVAEVGNCMGQDQESDATSFPLATTARWRKTRRNLQIEMGRRELP